MDPFRTALMVAFIVLAFWAPFPGLRPISNAGESSASSDFWMDRSNNPPSEGMTAQMMKKGTEHRGRKGKMRGKMTEARVPGIAPDQMPDPGSHGAELVIRYCSQCHNLPSPATHSAQEWVDVVDRMDRHMARMEGRGHREMMRITRATPEEKTALLTYLQAHALKTFTAGSLPDPDSPGAGLFRKFCVQCHVLPDPNLHTGKEWAGVVERMRMNMRVIGKPVITDQERDGIVEYLNKHAP